MVRTLDHSPAWSLRSCDLVGVVATSYKISMLHLLKVECASKTRMHDSSNCSLKRHYTSVSFRSFRRFLVCVLEALEGNNSRQSEVGSERRHNLLKIRLSMFFTANGKWQLVVLPNFPSFCIEHPKTFSISLKQIPSEIIDLVSPCGACGWLPCLYLFLPPFLKSNMFLLTAVLACVTSEPLSLVHNCETSTSVSASISTRKRKRNIFRFPCAYFTSVNQAL